MSIRRQRRDSAGIGSLKLMSALDLPTVTTRAVGEADSVDEFVRRLSGGVRASLGNPSRLHGLRAEAMFRAVLVALGGFQLLAAEDEGDLYYDDTAGRVKLPDYRVVDAAGRQLLVEVKTVPPDPRRLRHSIPAAEVQGLRRYGQLTDAPVAVAHYWAVTNVWTLVELERLRAHQGRYELDLADAMRFNQMARFGDRMVGTVPPLELRLEVEEVGQRTLPDTAAVVIRKAQLFAAGEPLDDPVEERIAFALFRYGGWNLDTPAEVDPIGRITAFTLRLEPPEEAREIVDRQGFAIVGALSSMYSALFNEVTLDDEGAVRRLDHHSEPGELGSLIPDDYFQRADGQLRLWVLEVKAAESGGDT